MSLLLTIISIFTIFIFIKLLLSQHKTINPNSLGLNSHTYHVSNVYLKVTTEPRNILNWVGCNLIGYKQRELLFYSMNTCVHSPKLVAYYKRLWFEQIILSSVPGIFRLDSQGYNADETIQILIHYDKIRRNWKIDNHTSYITRPYVRMFLGVNNLFNKFCIQEDIIPSHGDFRAGNITWNGQLFLIDFVMFSRSYWFYDPFYFLISSLNEPNEMTRILDVLCEHHNISMNKMRTLFACCVISLNQEISKGVCLGYTSCESGDYDQLRRGKDSWFRNLKFYFNYLSPEITQMCQVLGRNYYVVN
jgi:hypothetical protein